MWNEVATHHSERRQQTMSEKIVQLNEEAIKGAAQGVCLRQDGESSH